MAKRTKPNKLVVGIALIVAITGLAQVGMAQVGGGGRVLERDLRSPASGGGGLAPKANFRDEVYLRNALITGNVGGGKSFRGNVGYTAPNEFRGQLGSDSNFSFRRDSTSASSLRGVSSLKYQSNYSTGNSRSADSLVSRLGATGIAAASAAPGTSDTAFTRRTQQFQPRPGSLRSSGSFEANESLNPTLVGYTRGEDGVSKVTASGLLGVRTLKEILDKDNLKADEATSRSRTVDAARPGITPESLVSSVQEKPADPLNLLPNNNLQQSLTRTAYDNLRERMVKADEEDKKDRQLSGITPEEKKVEAGKDGQALTVDDRLEQLRNRLIPKGARLRDDQGRSMLATTAEEKAQREKEGKADKVATGEDDKSQTGIERAPLSRQELEAIDLIRRARAQSNTFVNPATGQRDFFSEHMARGEELLGNERYFDAEERFARALSIKPGDVTAQSARIHAQLGAGLYLSAAFNLRSLMKEHPEVAAIRFTGKTVPSPDRMRSLAADLRGKIAVAEVRKQEPLAADGFLLAYIGWQVEDKAMTREGLEAAKKGTRSKAEQESVSADESELIALLEGVWLAE